jgi:hypothetical protein
VPWYRHRYVSYLQHHQSVGYLEEVECTTATVSSSGRILKKHKVEEGSDKKYEEPSTVCGR